MKTKYTGNTERTKSMPKKSTTAAVAKQSIKAIKKIAAKTAKRKATKPVVKTQLISTTSQKRAQKPVDP